MLWAAGQRRVSAEARDRLSALYVGVRDGQLAALIAAGQIRWKNAGDHVPAYARPSRHAVVEIRSPAVRDTTLAALGVMFPGIVKRTDS